MALAPRLELRQSQQLVMTPQLQQAIKLLQLSNLELAEYVEEQLEQNPFLERGEYAEGAPEEKRGARDDAPAQSTDSSEIEFSEPCASSKAADALDAQYEDVDPNGTGSDVGGHDFKTNDWASASSGGGGDFSDRQFDSALSQDKSLSDILIEQLHVATTDPHALFIGAYLIDLIGDDGYLRESLHLVAERLGARYEEVLAVHEIITSFEPCGVGALDLKQCLSLQLKELDRFDPAMEAFVNNIELLAKGDLAGLMRATNSDAENVRDMVAEIKALNPKPGYLFGGSAVQVVEPDVFITKASDGGWKVELNNDTLPRVLVNQHYFAEISSSNASEDDQQFVSDQFANANWLAKSLDQRARTILKVSSEIVRQQDGFFAYGIKHLRPLNLKVVADAIEMHESTVSRVTSNKYMATPRGLFELKYFFTASIGSNNGAESFSAETIRHRIKELIDNETEDSILSDDKIVEILRSEGVDIARRTVAKYRETLKIPSSVQRRRAILQKAI